MKENSHQIASAPRIYALNTWRHSSRVAARFSLNLVLEQRRRNQTKLPTNEFTRLILKPRGPRHLATGPSPCSCGLAVAIGRSNPAVDPRTTTRAKPSCSNLARATLEIGRRCVVQCPRPLASFLSFRSWSKQSLI